jgi:nitric oxide reductase NorD protein
MRMQKSPNGKAIAPFLQTLAPVARRLHSRELMGRLPGDHAGHHGAHHRLHPRPPHHFPQPRSARFLHPGAVPAVPAQPGRPEELGGIRHPQLPHPSGAAEGLLHRPVRRQPRRAATGAPRHPVHGRGTQAGSLPARPLAGIAQQLVPYSTAFDELRKPVPYFDKLGMRIPDVYDDFILPSPAGGGWRAAPGEGATVESSNVAPSPPAGEGSLRSPASTATAPLWPTWSATGAGPKAQIADNWSPFQRMAVEFFEDCRIETLLCREYPGLRRIFLALHPKPARTPAIRKPPPACATAWPCCRAPCSTRTTATATPTCSISSPASMPSWPKARRTRRISLPWP